MMTSSFHIPTPLHVVREPLLMTQICCWPTFPFKLGGVINQLVRCIYTILGTKVQKILIAQITQLGG